MTFVYQCRELARKEGKEVPEDSSNKGPDLWKLTNSPTSNGLFQILVGMYFQKGPQGSRLLPQRALASTLMVLEGWLPSPLSQGNEMSVDIGVATTSKHHGSCTPTCSKAGPPSQQFRSLPSTIARAIRPGSSSTLSACTSTSVLGLDFGTRLPEIFGTRMPEMSFRVPDASWGSFSISSCVYIWCVLSFWDATSCSREPSIGLWRMHGLRALVLAVFWGFLTSLGLRFCRRSMCRGYGRWMLTQAAEAECWSKITNTKDPLTPQPLGQKPETTKPVLDPEYGAQFGPGPHLALVRFPQAWSKNPQAVRRIKRVYEDCRLGLQNSKAPGSEQKAKAGFQDQLWNVRRSCRGTTEQQQQAFQHAMKHMHVLCFDGQHWFFKSAKRPFLEDFLDWFLLLATLGASVYEGSGWLPFCWLAVPLRCPDFWVSVCILGAACSKSGRGSRRADPSVAEVGFHHGVRLLSCICVKAINANMNR